MNWDDLRIFLSVARTGSLTGAGQALRMDPATVGRRIARLEAALAAPVFVKSPQGYALTAAGQKLLTHAERAAGAIDEAAQIGGGAGAGVQGQLRIGAPDGCASYLLPQVTAALMRENPGLDIQIVTQPRAAGLSRREVDMTVTVSRPTAGRLVARRIGDYRLGLAASRAYLNSAPPIAAPADLAAHPTVGYIPEMIFDRELDYLSEAGLADARAGSNAVPVQLGWLRAGVGIGVAHLFALPFAPDLVRVLPDAIALKRTFWLVRHAEDRRRDRLTRLADSLCAGLAREIHRLEAQT